MTQLERQFAEKCKAHDVTRAMLRDKSSELIEAKSNLSDALATLRDVQDYLEAGQCLCDYRPEACNECERCRLLGDVKQPLPTAGRESAKFDKILNFEENAEQPK